MHDTLLYKRQNTGRLALKVDQGEPWLEAMQNPELLILLGLGDSF
jgi:hypothetical protein